jgi:glutaminyl-tRNA synthetase
MFAEKVGVARRDNLIDMALLEYCIREDLNKRAPRVMCVLDPVKLIIDNYPEGQVEELEAINNPEDLSQGTRKVPFSRELYIERSDFMENPPKNYFRLAPGQEVRLRYAYIVRCTSVDKDEQGNIVAIHCTYDPQTRGGNTPDGRKVKGTIHWVSVSHALKIEARLYDRLFTVPEPDNVEEGKSFLDYLNPNSLVVVEGYAEPSLQNAQIEEKFQFERVGYFCVDKDSTPQRKVFNRTVTLKDSWAKLQNKG